MKMIYLASPYSHDDPEIMARRRTFITGLGAELTYAYNVCIYPPITVSAAFKDSHPSYFGTNFAAWKRIDLCAIKHCDEVWVATMHGWEESIGVQAEIRYAKRKHIPVKYVDLVTGFVHNNLQGRRGSV